MKILQINAVGQSKSTGRTCKEMQEYINAHTAHECRTAFAQGKEDAQSVKIGNRLEWKLHGFLSRLTGKQGFFSSKGTKRLLQYMDDYAPDVVILRNLHGNYIHLPMLLEYLARKNIVTIAVLHDCWFYTGKCTHYTLTGCYRWQEGCHHCPRLKLDNPSWFIDATQMLWKTKKQLFQAIPRLAVVGVSDWITNEAKKSYLACATEIKRIYNWIDLEVFSPQKDLSDLQVKYNLFGKRVVLGVASHWTQSKGLGTFYYLSKQLSNGFQIVLLGGMDSQSVLPENVIHIPATNSKEELACWYSLADVFFTASLEETFGKVSAEALACGTPIVCFDSTANKELVGSGCGICVPLGDKQAALHAILEICAKGKNTFTSVCRDFAQKKFSMSARVQDYLSVMESLLEEK